MLEDKAREFGVEERVQPTPERLSRWMIAGATAIGLACLLAGFVAFLATGAFGGWRL